MIRKVIDMSYRLARRVAIGVLGSTVLVIGVIMLVTPGPALIVIPIGLAILSIEFAWARLWLKRIRQRLSSRSAGQRASRAEAHVRRVADDEER